MEKLGQMRILELKCLLKHVQHLGVRLMILWKLFQMILSDGGRNTCGYNFIEKTNERRGY